MERIGILSKSFESSIYQCSLKFKDPGLEDAYEEAELSLKFISVASKRLLIVSFFGHFLCLVIDAFTASGINSDYTFSVGIWLAFSLIPAAILLEAIFYFCKCVSKCRGITVTVVLVFVILYDNFAAFESQVAYPFIGTS